MLTPGERERIEEEECKRHEEEEYRAKIRSQLQGSAKPLSFLGFVGPGIAVVCTIAVVVIVIALAADLAHKSARRATETDGIAAAAPSLSPEAHYIPVNTNIASGQIVVRHGGYVNYQITITPAMREPVITGRFTASGGQGNDIAAVIADENGYTNWINGHHAQVYWSTQGKQTTGTFEVRLKPGIYYLTLSNRFSVVTDKYVVLDANLKYLQLQAN